VIAATLVVLLAAQNPADPQGWRLDLYVDGIL
jgi:hypothetical protein